MIPSRKIRILCADDHPVVRDGVSFTVANEMDMEIVAEASDGLSAVEAYELHRPDVVLMDLQMPILNGIGAMEAIRKKFPKAKCIVLTTYEGSVQAAGALNAGARGYLIKTMLRKHLVDAIRRVHAGQAYIPKEVAASASDSVLLDRLSPREVAVLANVAEGRSNKGIADELAISENTVKTYMKSILSKLRANDRTHAVLLALRRGFLEY